MKSQTKTAIALFGGAATLALAIGFGGGSELTGSTTTPIATPTSPVTPAPPPTAGPGAPATQPSRDFDSPVDGDAPSGCIHGLNC